MFYRFSYTKQQRPTHTLNQAFFLFPLFMLYYRLNDLSYDNASESSYTSSLILRGKKYQILVVIFQIA